jgi:LacI family transcriptional regulator
MILLCSFDPAIVAIINELEDDGVRVASIVSDIPGSARTMFAGPNNMVVGRVGGDLIAHAMRHQSGNIAVISPESHQEDHASRLAGFTQVLRANDIARDRIRIIRYGDYELQERTMDQFLAKELSEISNLDAIYLTGGGTKATSRAISTLKGLRPLFVANDLTPTSRRLLIERKVDFIVSSTQGEEIRAALSGLSRAMSEPFYSPKDFESQIHVFTRHNLPTRSS